MEIWSAAIIAAGGFLAAALWPWWTAWLRQRRFRRLICRELQEISPHIPEGEGSSDRPWWQHLTKRFVHEEVFARERISENRDFILSLHPTLTYHVSQLWIALEKHDHVQWLHHLEQLSIIPQLKCDELKEIAASWQELIDAKAPQQLTGLLRTPRSMNLGPEHAAHLFDARRAAYADLVELTRPAPEGRSRAAPSAFTDWFYSNGNGLLLSGDAFNAFDAVRKSLEHEATTEKSVKDCMTALRTELKIDLGVRHPDERDTDMARSIERYGS